ncbi:hypothetical protein [Haloplanus natans]|uniref:hypothetical protein n=1 Tax=Haloplanus natans TaxID=376171 RepID=UPI0006781C92|nr:hypothetical protein [Haloplanus natans]
MTRARLVAGFDGETANRAITGVDPLVGAHGSVPGNEIHMGETRTTVAVLGTDLYGPRELDDPRGVRRRRWAAPRPADGSS